MSTWPGVPAALSPPSAEGPILSLAQCHHICIAGWEVRTSLEASEPRAADGAASRIPREKRTGRPHTRPQPAQSPWEAREQGAQRPAGGCHSQGASISYQQGQALT